MFCACNEAITNNIDNQILSEIGSQASSELKIYENPYMVDKNENDTFDYELYWTLRENGIGLFANTCKEMSEKHWQNIKSKERILQFRNMF